MSMRKSYPENCGSWFSEIFAKLAFLGKFIQSFGVNLPEYMYISGKMRDMVKNPKNSEIFKRKCAFGSRPWMFEFIVDSSVSKRKDTQIMLVTSCIISILSIQSEVNNTLSCKHDITWKEQQFMWLHLCDWHRINTGGQDKQYETMTHAWITIDWS